MKTLALNILDIAQNSIRAGANEIVIEINESVNTDIYEITIRDNGSGIPSNIIAKISDPYVTTRTKRNIGMGLPLLKYHAEICGGKLEIKSSEGNGTEVRAIFIASHIDRQPLGDITGVLRILIAANPKKNFIYMHATDKGKYTFSSKETMEYLEMDSLYDNQLLKDIGNMIDENLKELDVSGLMII